jgi:hypothetical protein
MTVSKPESQAIQKTNTRALAATSFPLALVRAVIFKPIAIGVGEPAGDWFMESKENVSRRRHLRNGHPTQPRRYERRLRLHHHRRNVRR